MQCYRRFKETLGTLYHIWRAFRRVLCKTTLISPRNLFPSEILWNKRKLNFTILISWFAYRGDWKRPLTFSKQVQRTQQKSELPRGVIDLTCGSCGQCSIGARGSWGMTRGKYPPRKRDSRRDAWVDGARRPPPSNGAGWTLMRARDPGDGGGAATDPARHRFRSAQPPSALLALTRT